jgi:hypothetical protein
LGAIVLPERIQASRRSYHRENVALIAQYFIVGRSAKHLGCTIINLSCSGAGALFPRKEKIEAGDIILIDMIAPATFQHISILGEIKRCYKKDNAVFCGIQFQDPLSDLDFSVLCDIPANQ